MSGMGLSEEGEVNLRGVVEEEDEDEEEEGGGGGRSDKKA